MNEFTENASEWATTNKRNTRNLRNWTAAWVLSMALANFGPVFLWEGNRALTLSGILLNLAIGAGMILSNKRFLQGLDERQQKIQLQAMGITLGVGLIVGMAYSNLDTTNLIPFDAEISHLVIVMALTYLAAVVLGLRKYR